MKKVLIVPEAVDSHGVKLSKGNYTSAELKKKGFKSTAIAAMVGCTVAHWGYEDDKPSEKAKAPAK